ncbi:hypothetical protein [Salinibaculum salinum]|uniref:hypothetical protein n=1 Tax=Salinibaculum salinum TaxID=3131996 RepID=UPI0030ED9367
MTAGCLGKENNIARCASQGEGSDSQHLRQIVPVEGSEQVALGIVVSTDAVQEDQYHAVDVRNRDGMLVTSIPLEDNRDMNRLTQDDFPVLSAADGELYGVSLGPPPVHGEFTASLVSPEGTTIATATTRFNCYSADGSLP